jgi:hypothetical protein
MSKMIIISFVPFVDHGFGQQYLVGKVFPGSPSFHIAYAKIFHTLVELLLHILKFNSLANLMMSSDFSSFKNILEIMISI